MVRIQVPVQFTGSVTVTVPDSVPVQRRSALAEKVALARVLATTENPDAPEDQACCDYAESFGMDEQQAERDWDGCQTTTVDGVWQLASVGTAVHEENHDATD